MLWGGWQPPRRGCHWERPPQGCGSPGGLHLGRGRREERARAEGGREGCRRGGGGSREICSQRHGGRRPASAPGKRAQSCHGFAGIGASKSGPYLPLQQAGEAALLLLLAVLMQEGCRRDPGC